MNRRERRLNAKADRGKAGAGRAVIHGPGINLHIGGLLRAPGWTVFDALPGSHVDVVGDCRDMSQLADGSCAVVYASHVLEHLGYDKDLFTAVNEIFRVLQPGGQFLVSVPDLDTLCALLVDKSLPPEDRFFVMRMLFGGRETEYDIHYVGLNEEFLRAYLIPVGFVDIARVEGFGLFEDSSLTTFKDRPISLNMRALKSAAG